MRKVDYVDDFDDGDDGDVYTDDENDPDWRKTPLFKRLQKIRV